MHFCRFACSIPEQEEPLFHSKCNIEHTDRCMYCDLVPQCIEETKKLIQFVQPITDEKDKIISEEFKYDIKMIEETIEKYKHQQKRDFLQSSEWEAKFDEKKDDRAYVTIDFGMKIIPRKSDQAQVPVILIEPPKTAFYNRFFCQNYSFVILGLTSIRMKNAK